MKKDIPLVMLSKRTEIKVPPFPLMYLSYTLKKERYDVKVIHCLPSEMEEHVKKIVEIDPLFIGFSVLTGPPVLYSLQMSKMLKEKGVNAPIVWGGVHPSLLPRQCLEEECIDIVVIGEGEKTIVEIANFLKANKSLKNIHGLGYKTKGKIVINKPRSLIKDLDKFKLDFNCIELKRYVYEKTIKSDGQNKKIRSLGYYSSRGCPYNCGFCYNQEYHHRMWRGQSVKEVVKDILYLKQKYNLGEVRFWDDNFFANPKRAIQILEKIDIATGLEIRIDMITPELAKRLKKLKSSYLVIGAESGNDRILNLINKKFNTETTIKAVKLLAQNDIDVQYSFIFGLPTETKEELYDTINLMLKIKSLHSGASFTAGIYMPYPRTKLFNMAVKKGFMPPKQTKDWHLIDRWENTVDLPWINKKMCLNTRHLFAMLDWGKGIGWWAEFRLRKKWLKFNQDLRAIIFLKNLR